MLNIKKIYGAAKLENFLGLFSLSVIFFLWLPIIILIIVSFSSGRVTQWPPPGFTLHWYSEMLSSPRAYKAIRTSLIIASATSIFTTILGIMVAYGLTQLRVKNIQLIYSIIYLPMIISPLIIGISLVLYYHIIKLPLGMVSVIIAHMLRSFPFVALIMVTSFLGVSKTLIEAALDLGASQFKTFIRVILPIILPGIVASILISFTISFDDISTTYFVIGGGNVTVQTYIMEQIEFIITPEMNALTASVLFLSFVFVTIFSLLQRKLQR
jgi:spermidine/putrescine transport system permease protein